MSYFNSPIPAHFHYLMLPDQIELWQRALWANIEYIRLMIEMMDI